MNTGSGQGLIATTPGITKKGRPMGAYVQGLVEAGQLRLERIPAATLGTPRDLEVYRAKRARGGLIVDWANKATDKAYCCEYWADLHIGMGPCGYRCADCFLILTHRVKADPSRHILYENTGDFVDAAKKWLKDPRARQTLGLGVDCSDSLLYEGVTGYARALIPLFADPKSNPFGRRLLLLTKSANVHYLKGLPTANIAVSFSLNPQPIADIFEGHYPDRVRITPDIKTRLEASRQAKEMGFAVRWRIDPIIPVEGWESIYAEFLAEAASSHCPERVTVGLYRRMGPGLPTFARLWGLDPMSWQPEAKLAKDGGVHLQLPAAFRAAAYAKIRRAAEAAWPDPARRPHLALCKERGSVREACALESRHCNCE